MSFNFTLVSIDPGIDISGYCVISHTLQDNKSRCTLDAVSCIKADLGTTDARVRFLCAQFENIVVTLKHSVDHDVLVSIECPNEALYGGNASRVSGVIKLIAAAYGILGRLTPHCPVFRIKPNEWQPNKKQREIKDVKAWSRQNANAKLAAFRSTLPKFTTTTQDMADALSIGVCSLAKILNKEWLV